MHAMNEAGSVVVWFLHQFQDLMKNYISLETTENLYPSVLPLLLIFKILKQGLFLNLL